MKKSLIMTTVAVVATAIGFTPVYGEEMMGPGQEMMREYSKEKQSDPQSVKDFQESMYRRMMEKYGPDWDMMSGYGRGRSMMDEYGMWPGMKMGYGMHHGYGMGPGMMGGFGRGPGMMGGHGFCQGPVHVWDYKSDEYNTFMNETKETRKKLHDLHFEYGEMMRNPKTTIGELRTMEKEMHELQKELEKKVIETK